MRKIISIGLNHKTAPVELRERLAFSDEDTERALEILCKDDFISEIVIFSTCNRTELLAVAADDTGIESKLKSFLADFKAVPRTSFENSLYTHRGGEAVKHTFMVASSLDSMVVGEPQILGQVKAAYRTAADKKTSGVILNKLIHKAFFTAKRIRTVTEIGDHAVSISYSAVELAKKIFGRLEGKKILLIGAGEMAELAMEHLKRNRVGEIHVANRTFERGLELAKKFQGAAIKFQEIFDALQSADIVVSSVAASGFIIKREDVKKIIRTRRNRPLFFIDIAVPRNIDPETNRLPNIYVYDIDDLKGVIEENIRERNKEAVKAERIIDEAVIQFRRWHESLSVTPTIVALREKMETIAVAERAKTFSSLKNMEEREKEAVTALTDSIINKILHDPILFLKGDGCRGDRRRLYLDFTKKLFNLDE